MPTCSLIATFTRPTLGLTPEGYHYRPQIPIYGIVDGDRLLWWVRGGSGGAPGNVESWVSNNRGVDWTFFDLGFDSGNLRGGVVWNEQYAFSRVTYPTPRLWLSTNGLDWTTETMPWNGPYNIAPVGSDLYGFGSSATTNTDIFRRTGVGSWEVVGYIPGEGFSANYHEFPAQIPGQSEVLLMHAATTGYPAKWRVSRITLPTITVTNWVEAHPNPTSEGDSPGTVWPSIGPVTANVYVASDFAAPAKSIYRTLDGGDSWHYTTASFLSAAQKARLASPVRFGNRTYAVIMRAADNKEVHVASIGDDESEWQIECEIGSASGECQFAASGLDASGNLVVYAMLWTAGNPNDTFRVFRLAIGGRALVSFSELQVPSITGRALVSFSALQVPDTPVSPETPSRGLQPLGASHLGDWRNLQQYTWEQLQAFTWAQLAGSGGPLGWETSSPSSTWTTDDDPPLDGS